jgi:hypothetical protein
MSRSFVFKSFLAERTETRELHQQQLLDKLDSFQIDSMIDAIFSSLGFNKRLTLLLLEIKQISCVILQNKTKHVTNDHSEVMQVKILNTHDP